VKLGGSLGFVQVQLERLVLTELLLFVMQLVDLLLETSNFVDEDGVLTHVGDLQQSCDFSRESLQWQALLLQTLSVQIFQLVTDVFDQDVVRKSQVLERRRLGEKSVQTSMNNGC